MAELQDKTDITIEELEESLGEVRLPKFIAESEEVFLSRIDRIVKQICSDKAVKAIFISGPTSSGKTTFTMRLADGITQGGRTAHFLSLDDYYNITELNCDKDGRPDFETIEALDIARCEQDIKDILDHKTVIPPHFNFMTRIQEEGSPESAIRLPDDGVLVVEGLHGLSPRISGNIDRSMCAKVFIMPYGNVFCDSKLMDSREIRLIRRIVRDNRHRDAHAISTIDYWPMIARSEESFVDEYLAAADYHVNSFLAYEPLVLAPMALGDIRIAVDQINNGTAEANVFMKRSPTGKPFADLSAAMAKAAVLTEHLNMIPVIDQERVPERSILNEFIGS